MRLTNLFIFLCVLFTTFSCSDDTPQEIDPDNKPVTADEIILGSANYESLLFNSSSGEQAIKFKTAGSWKVEIPSSVSEWIEVSPTSGSKGNSLMNITVSTNETFENRAAEIMLVSGTKRQVITVNQMQKDALVVAKPSYTVEPEGGEVVVEVSHNVEFDVKISAYWITSVSSRAYEKTNLCFNIMKNPNHSNREGSIVVTSKDGKLKQEIKIYQSARLGLAVSEREKIFSSDSHTFDVEIKSNVEYEVIDPKIDWLHRVESRALTSRTLRYQLDANENVENRTAQILLVSSDNELKDTITVIQMQKNALVVAKPSYEVSPKGEEIEIPLGHNIDFTCAVEGDWITRIQPQSRAYVTDNLKFRIASNVKLEGRKGTIVFASEKNHLVQKVTVIQKYDKERKALHEFYQSTNGNKWKNHTNWCSELPLNDWYGIQTDKEGYVTDIIVSANGLQGTFPKSFQNLTSLSKVNFSDNAGLTGAVPITVLQSPSWNTEWPLIVNGTKLQADVTAFPAPKFSVKTVTGKKVTNEIYAKNKLTALFQFKKNSAECARFIPTLLDLYDQCHKQKFEVLGISFDDLGTTTDYIDKSKMIWDVFCYHDNEAGYQFSTVNEKTPLLHLVNTEGRVVFSSTINDLSRLKSFMSQYFNMSVGIRSLNEELFSRLIYNCKEYPNKWVFEGDKPAVINFYSAGNASCQIMNVTLQQLAQEFEGKVDFYQIDADKEPGLFDMMAKENEVPCVFVMSNVGDPKLLKGVTDIETLRRSIAKIIQNSVYVSTDYSSDGKAVQLLKSSKGKGIDIVLLGDGYSDRQIASGEYEKDMKFACDKLFTEEPYTSFKEFFNVYYVAAVSKNEGYHAGGKTAFDGWFSLGTQVGGNDGRCMNYTLKAVPYEKMDEVSIAVVMNSSRYAGTCWMFGKEYKTDFGTGTTIAYFPKSTDKNVFEQLVHHEVGGHGFAKLADEYATASAKVPVDVVDNYKKNEPRGWWKNIDFTDNPKQIKWRHFLSDSRYEGEKLGVYEGGATFIDS